MIPQPDELRHITDATCLACGCLCDDIELTTIGARIIESLHTCPTGREWFRENHSDGDRPEAMIDGRPVNRDEALSRAVTLLIEARAPIVTGLIGTTVETQRIAVALADRLGAILAPAPQPSDSAALPAFQRVGRVGATLGEVRNRADVVVFWGVDPATTHPRHFERFSIDPRGRFTPEGRAGRTILVADHAPTPTSECADNFLQVPLDRRFESLWALRALVRGVTLDRDAIRMSTGLPPERLLDWFDRLKRARYGAWFFGPGSGDPAEIEAVLRLVRDLNDVTRFVALPLGGRGNPSGFHSVAAWQTGFAASIDFAHGYPRFLPGEASVEARLASGAADVALIVGAINLQGALPESLDLPRQIPAIVISPGATRSVIGARVAFSSATPGIHTSGTVVRADGAWLPLRPALASRFPTDTQWLKLLLDRLDFSRCARP